jgi:hypothetical protein
VKPYSDAYCKEEFSKEAYIKLKLYLGAKIQHLLCEQHGILTYGSDLEHFSMLNNYKLKEDYHPDQPIHVYIPNE